MERVAGQVRRITSLRANKGMVDIGGGRRFVSMGADPVRTGISCLLIGLGVLRPPVLRSLYRPPPALLPEDGRGAARFRRMLSLRG